MIDLKKLTTYSKSIGLYLSASIIPMMLSLAVNPLVAINMSPTDYAISGYYTSFSVLFTPIIVFYMLHYYTKSYYQVNEDERFKLKAVLFKALIYFSGFMAIMCCIGLILYLKYFNAESEMPIYPYVFLSVFSIPLTGIYTLMLTDYRISRESKKFFRLSVVNGVIGVALVALFVVLLKWGAVGKLLAPLVCSIIFFMWAAWQNRELFNITFDWKHFGVILKFCAPLMFAAMLEFFSRGYDRVLLERLDNYVELGYYVVGVQFAAYLTLMSTSINSTFQPDIFESMAKKDYKRALKFILLMVISISVIVALFIVLSPFVVKILTAGRYMLSVKYTQILSLSVITSTMFYASNQIIIAEGKSNIIMVSRIITTILLIIMFNVLIDKYQFLGAAWGTVISFLVMLIINIILLVFSKKRQESK
ncbi:MAG: oligosaccharide flippase family protein [Bacteroidales bacterium]